MKIKLILISDANEIKSLGPNDFIPSDNFPGQWPKFLPFFFKLLILENLSVSDFSCILPLFDVAWLLFWSTNRMFGSDQIQTTECLDLTISANRMSGSDYIRQQNVWIWPDPQTECLDLTTLRDAHYSIKLKPNASNERAKHFQKELFQFLRLL